MPQAKKKAGAAKKTTRKTTAKSTAKTRVTGAAAKKQAAPKKTSAAASAKKKTTAKTAKTGTHKSSTKRAAAKSAPKRKAAATTPPAGDNLLFRGMRPYEPKKGEDYMSEDQEQHFRDLLKAWKRELMEEVDRTVHHMQDEAANFPDPNDRATQESEFSLELRTRDRERKLIKKIDEALVSIDAGEYGFCESCGIEIGIRRLEARPTATLCIDCKTLDEIRERQMG